MQNKGSGLSHLEMPARPTPSHPGDTAAVQTAQQGRCPSGSVNHSISHAISTSEHIFMYLLSPRTHFGKHHFLNIVPPRHWFSGTCFHDVVTFSSFKIIFDVDHFLSLYWICYNIVSVFCFGFPAMRHVASLLSNQGLNPYPLHWKVKSWPLDCQGSSQRCAYFGAWFSPGKAFSRWFGKQK